MRTFKSQKKHESQWRAPRQLKYSDFVDDLALLSYIRPKLETKTPGVIASPKEGGPNIRVKRSKTLEHNSTSRNKIKFDREAIGKVEGSKQMSNTVAIHEESDVDVKANSSKQGDHSCNWRLSETQNNCQSRLKSG